MQSEDGGISALSTMGTVLTILLYLAGGVGAVATAGMLVSMLVDDFSTAQGAIVGVSLIASAIFFLICLICVPLVAWWVWRAAKNLVSAGAQGMRYSPGWAVGSFFTPVANLIVPFFAMRELANRSAGEDQYQADSEVPIASAWWATHVAGLLVLTAICVIILIETVPGLFVTMPPMAASLLLALASGFLAASAICLALLIRKITASQRARHHFAHASTFG